MTNDPSRRVIFLMGPDGLNTLLGKSGYDMLLSVGYCHEHIVQMLEEGMIFKLALFTAEQCGKAAKVASWENVLELVAEEYPYLKEKLYMHLDGLKVG